MLVPAGFQPAPVCHRLKPVVWGGTQAFGPSLLSLLQQASRPWPGCWWMAEARTEAGGLDVPAAFARLADIDKLMISL